MIPRKEIKVRFRGIKVKRKADDIFEAYLVDENDNELYRFEDLRMREKDSISYLVDSDLYLMLRVND